MPNIPTDRGNPPLPAPILAEPIPGVIPVEPSTGAAEPSGAVAGPRLIQFPRDDTGLAPERPPGPPRLRSNGEVARDVANLIQVINEPEAEISVVEGQFRTIQTRRDLTRYPDRRPVGRRRRAAQRPARIAPPEYPGEDVRHDQLDSLGPDRPSGLVPGAGHDRYQGPGSTDSSGLSRRSK